MLQRRSNDNSSLQPASGGGDRRCAPRYPAGETWIILSWNEGEAYRTVECRLGDISLGGGSAVAKTAPPVDTPVWFRLKSDDQSPWVGAKVLKVSRTGFLGLGGQRRICWQFSESCPYQIFKAAINGFSTSVDIDEVNMPGYSRRDWRG